MTHSEPESNDILSYALQRRALITLACELVQVLGLPVDRAPDEPDVALRSLAYNWAINVHPDLMRWYRDAAHATQTKCRFLHVDQEVPAVAGIERLVLRDLKFFTAAIDAHQELPAEMQKRILDMTAPMNSNSAIVAPPRLATILPGSLL